jgi:hypothetical protein
MVLLSLTCGFYLQELVRLPWDDTDEDGTYIGQAGLKTLGVAEAREALGITGSQTATFTVQAVDSTSVLVKFTWGGDATLDGKINIDDYGRNSQLRDYLRQ